MSSAFLSFIPLTVTSFKTLPLVPTAAVATCSARSRSLTVSTVPFKCATCASLSQSTFTAPRFDSLSAVSVVFVGSFARVQAPADNAAASAPTTAMRVMSFIEFLPVRAHRLRQGDGGPPKLHAKAEAGPHGGQARRRPNRSLQADRSSDPGHNRSPVIKRTRRCIVTYAH